MKWFTSSFKLMFASMMALCLSLQAFGEDATGRSGPDEAEVVKHLRVIWTNDPQTRAMVCWDTEEEGTDHRVYYDTESHGGVLENYRHSQVSTETGPYHVHEKSKSKEPSLYYHHTQLKDLKPDTIYYFVFSSDGAISKEYHFKTAPAEDKPFKMFYGSDSQGNSRKSHHIYKLISKKFEEDDSILALAHGGDFVGTGDAPWQWEGMLKIYQLTTTSTGRVLPLMPAYGNHDMGPVFGQVMGFPGGKGNHYYATRLSSEVLWVALNTCGGHEGVGTGGAQQEFLAAALAEAHDNRWKVAHYHDPVYPAVKRPSGGRQNWVPLFEKHNLTLACEADGHVLKRTVPIRDGKHDPTGVVYIGEGGLDNDQRWPKKDRWYIQSPGMTDRVQHFHLLSFTREALTVEVFDVDGKVIDTHVIAARPSESRDQ
ncbi:fibronectin type III domain-containing protein [Haloferula sp. A504]|uniref:fibronectin type III domain-containing protein n=1 Tax=Haloferula sp. A504 TaxID=3373601 RepID=UPI0031CA5653|nr:fibronectin type III domain-containing protein [Verrucomicrobiaceae bacterium E54]